MLIWGGGSKYCAYVIYEWSLSLDEKNCTLTRMTGRRQKLPTLMPDNSSLNLWNLLCKNIGKDLSKISMPGKINQELLNAPLHKQIITLQKFNISIYIDISIKTHQFVCIRQVF
jgi:hypothetical protein